MGNDGLVREGGLVREINVIGDSSTSVNYEQLILLVIIMQLVTF